MEALVALFFWLIVLAQITLGFIQPISALLIYSCIERKNSQEATDLIRYLSLVALYLSVFFQYPEFNGLLLFVFYVIIPWTFAIWFIRNRFHHRRRNKSIKEFNDELKLKQIDLKRKEKFKPPVLRKKHLFAS